MPVTIRDLARKLNLSITTVSRALDGYADVAEATRKRVIEAAGELGYEPSYAARQLRRKQTNAIGYILPAVSPRFSDPYYTSFLTGLCDEAASRQIDLVISSAPPHSEEEQRQYRHWVQTRRVGGIVLNRLRAQDWRIDYLTRHQIPFASIGKHPEGSPYPCIDVQDRQAFTRVVLHLVEQGHRRIALIGGPDDLLLSQQRLAGYQDGLKRARIAFEPTLHAAGDLTEEGGYRAAQHLLGIAEPPTAILSCNDLTALGVLRAARERRLHVGSELAIAGYDGLKETEFTTPPLTTISQPTYEIARRLVVMLDGLLHDRPPGESEVVIQPQLIVRASTRG